MPFSKTAVVIGATGQLGTDVVKAFVEFDYKVVPLSHAELEVTRPEQAQDVIQSHNADVVINCAALHRVDACEDEPAEAFAVNAVGALNVARACAKVGARCVYVSTDYVFDGEQDEPCTETDAPRPINVYGASKLAGEHLVRQASPNWLIVRVASLFGKVGASGKGGNFVETILARARSGEPLRVVDDVIMSPTYTHDAALALRCLIRRKATGVFHLTNAGACSWHEFAVKAVSMANLDAAVEPVSSESYPSKARRPANSSLSSARLEESEKQCLRPWPQALKAYLVEKGYTQDES